MGRSLVLLACVAGVVAALFVLPALGRTDAATVTVTGTDSRLTLAPASVSAGDVVFRIRNRGRLTHVFTAKRVSVSVKPGATVTAKATYKTAGTLTVSWKAGSSRLAKTLVVKAPVAATTTTAAPLQTTTIQVHMTEFRFALSQTTVPAGTVIFQLVNDGEAPHDLRLTGVTGGGSQLLAPGQSGTLTIALPKPGAYQFTCTLPGHAAAGMTGTLTVT